MGVLDNLRAAQGMLKDMNPGDVQQLMQQAQETKAMIEKLVRDLVAQEIAQRGLVTRDEARELARAAVAEATHTDPSI